MGLSAQWFAVLYDLHDRQFMTGLITYSGTRQQLQDYVNQNFTVAGSNTATTTNLVNPNILYVDNRESGKQNYNANVSIEFLPGFESEPSANFIAEIVVSNATTTVTYGGANLPPNCNLIVLTTKYYDDYSWIASENNALPSSLNTAQLQGSWLNTTSATRYSYPLPLVTTTSRTPLQAQKHGFLTTALLPIYIRLVFLTTMVIPYKYITLMVLAVMTYLQVSIVILGMCWQHIIAMQKQGTMGQLMIYIPVLFMTMQAGY